MRSIVLLKVGAVLSSALLMAAFVAYRAGAFSGLTAGTAPTAPSESTPAAAAKEKTSADAAPAPKPSTTASKHAPMLMPGSKAPASLGSLEFTAPPPIVQVAPPPAAPPSVTPQKPPTLIPSSKSIILVPPLQAGSGPLTIPPADIRNRTPPLADPPAVTPPPAAQQPTPAPRPESGGPQR